MIINPLWIAGKARTPNLIQGSSIFYPDYRFQSATAGPLEAAAAIGAARQAERLTLLERKSGLERAADRFSYTEEELEHAVRMTGMPVMLVKELCDEIPQILRAIPEGQGRRFQRFGALDPVLAEDIDGKSSKAYYPPGGFCYAITPGNDPRAAAIVAGNLCYLGIPFIIRASPRDAFAALVIQSLVESGFDPRACNLVYLDRHDPLGASAHFQILDASQVVWTFGPAQEIDPTLRYRPTGERKLLDVSGLGSDSGSLESLAKSLSNLPDGELHARMCVEETQEDHFCRKRVLRHEAGNCALVVFAPWSAWLEQALYQSLGYPLACTATRSLLAVGEEDWVERTAGFLAGLPVGDPLDPATRIGYVEPRVLDELESLVRANRMSVEAFGGRRISQIQSTPLLVTSQEAAPDFFAREIPAYVVALRVCKDIDEAVEQINLSTCEIPRLAVSFLHAPEPGLDQAIAKVRAHTVLVDAPTTKITPFLHEGNDYALLLSNSKLVIDGNTQGGSLF